MRTLLLLTAWACLGANLGALGQIQDGKLAGKRVVFTSLESYSIGKQQLPVMRELRARGASVEFWGHSRLWKLMQSEGFKCSGAEDMLHPESVVDAITELQQARLLDSRAKDWLKCSRAFNKVFDTILASTYDQTLEAWVKYVNATGVPDLVVTDFFSLAIQDWANAHNVSLVIYNAVAFGHVGGYGDTWALPDTLMASTVAEHQNSFRARFMKLVHTLAMIVNTMPTANKLNAHRAKYGFVQYMPPTGMWDGRHVIVTWDAYSNVPRMTSPLVHFVGLLSGTAPFNKTATPIDTLPETDQETWAWLDEQQATKPGGTVYIAFGTEAFPPEASFATLMAGVKAYCANHKASALLALRPILRERLRNASLAFGPDVKTVDWVTQEMVLAHPATRVFLTHGGQGSAGEAILSGVPLLMVPFFADQPWNTVRLQELGVGLGIDHFNMSAEEVSAKLHRVASEPSFRQSVGRLRDLNLVGSGPASRAADVIESELLVHSSQLLRPIESMTPWYIANGVDVLGTVLAVVLGLLYMLYQTLRTFVVFIVPRSPASADATKKRQ